MTTFDNKESRDTATPTKPTMKNAALGLIGAVCCFLVLYGMAAILSHSISPADWTDFTRLCVAIGGPFAMRRGYAEGMKLRS